VQIRAGNMSVIPDDYRKEAIEWMGQDDLWTFVSGR